MSEANFKQLLEEYTTGDISESGQKALFALLEQEKYRILLGHVLHEKWEQGSYEEKDNPKIASLIEQNVLSKINEKANVSRVRYISFFRRYRTAVAIVFLFVITGAVWLLQRKGEDRDDIGKTDQVLEIDIAPGTNGAILTLDNGEQIILDSVHDGLIARQGNSNIIKKEDGLSYQSNANGNAIVYNTITTPRGRQYPNLILADGSKVWLDAGSSIRFPVAFTGSQREVEITGQVWFDVVHNNEMPFKVIAKGVEINDLGTQFNVNAYGDEALLKVTLLQGIVRIQTSTLTPGQQAQVSSAGQLQLVNNVDLEEIMAWKNGYFNFHNADIKAVMRELSRWYDIDVSFEGNVPDQQFNGEIGRSLSLKEVLDGLAFTNVKFKIEEGRKLIILP